MNADNAAVRNGFALQAVRLALAEIAAEIGGELSRDKLTRVDAVLGRVVLSLDRPPDSLAADEEATTASLTERARAAWEALQQEEKRMAAMGQALPAAAAAAQSDDATSAVQVCIRRRFPQAQNLVVTAMRKLPGGRSKHTYIVDLDDTGGALPQRIVLRTDSNRNTAEDSVMREYPAIRAVFDAGCPAPAPLFFEADPAVMGVPFIAFPFLEGQPAGTLWGAKEDGGKAARALAVALATLHRIPVEAVPGEQLQSARTATDNLLQRFESNWQEGRPDDCPIIAAGFAWLHEHLGVLEGEATLVHGDAHFSNILMNGDNLSCLLDWEFWHVGHPAEDLAYCRRYVEQTLPWTEFMALYRGAGGREISEAELDLFTIWAPLRNAVLSAKAAWLLGRGEDLDLETAAIGLSTYPRMTANLARLLMPRLSS